MSRHLKNNLIIGSLSLVLQISINLTNVLISVTRQPLYEIIRWEMFTARAAAISLFLVFAAEMSRRNEISPGRYRAFILSLCILAGVFTGQGLSQPLTANLKYKKLERFTRENTHLITACLEWKNNQGEYPDSLSQLIPDYLDRSLFEKNSRARIIPANLKTAFSEKEIKEAETGFKHYLQGKRDFMELYFLIPYKNGGHMRIIWNPDKAYPPGSLSVGEWAVEERAFY